MSYTIAPEMQDFRERFDAKFPDFTHDEMDWLRCSYALRFVTGKTVLEVGPGVGMMVDTLLRRGLDVSALDLAPHSSSLFPEGFKLKIASITNDRLELADYSTVICMEVLEHIEAEHNLVALKNLRRASSQRIIMTVPYNEKEPLWYHDKPGGHRQKFTIDKAADLFPNAYATIIPRYSEGWLFIVEDRVRPAPFFTVVSRDRLTEIFSV